jgi:hypothetical protein
LINARDWRTGSDLGDRRDRVHRHWRIEEYLRASGLAWSVLLTCADITEKLSATLGRTVGSVTLTPGELAATLKTRGLPAGFADDVAALAGEVAGGALAVTTPAVRDRTGRAPRSFDQFITANVTAMEAALGGRPHGR